MQLRLGSRALFSCFALLPALGCGVDDPLSGDSTAAEDAGSVGLQLRVGDATLNSVSYVITGNGFVKTGAIDVSRSSTISALIGGIPAGSGYSMTLSATDANTPAMQCAAAASFNITARATTTTTIKLLCHLPNNNGSVQLDGTTSVCPRIDVLSVEPSEVTVGGTMTLGSSVTDSDELPAPATYSWSANGGNLTGADSSQASFECTAPGTFQISLLVSDTACSDSATATVTCSPNDGAPGPRPQVKINEVESNQGTPGDWTELYNADDVPADISQQPSEQQQRRLRDCAAGGVHRRLQAGVLVGRQ